MHWRWPPWAKIFQGPLWASRWFNQKINGPGRVTGPSFRVIQVKTAHLCAGGAAAQPQKAPCQNPLPTGAVAALGSQGSLRGGTGPPGGLTPATMGAWGVTVGNGCGGRQVAAARFAPKPSFNWPLGRALGVGGGGCCPFFCWRGPSGGLTPPPTKNQPPCTRAHKQHRPLQKKPESPRPCGPV